MNQTLTGIFSIEQIDELELTMSSYGYELLESVDRVLSTKGPGWTLRLYPSGKAVIQGTDVSIPRDYLTGIVEFSAPTPKKNKQSNSPALTNAVLPRIGSDESGKGDYFGPLVVAAVWVDDDLQRRFESMGVTDSKKLNDTVISRLAPEIMRSAPHEIVNIGPKKYNDLYSSPSLSNVNRLLGWAHARALENVISRNWASLAVADQFGDKRYIESQLFEFGKKTELHQMPRAEADTAVAAASVIARYQFVRAIERLGNQWQIRLPKGASSAVVIAAKQLVSRHGPDVLRQVAKYHFKTTRQVLSSSYLDD